MDILARMNNSDAVARKRADAGEQYERPQVKVLGTLAELTQGIVPTSTDGFGPGSAL